MSAPIAKLFGKHKLFNLLRHKILRLKYALINNLMLFPEDKKNWVSSEAEHVSSPVAITMNLVGLPVELHTLYYHLGCRNLYLQLQTYNYPTAKHENATNHTTLFAF